MLNLQCSYQENFLDIKGGRHPVIKKQLPVGQEYITNDVYLDTDSQQIIMITGPIWPVNQLF